MELIVIFAAGVVLYCGWLTMMDDLQEFRRSRLAAKMKKMTTLQPHQQRFRVAAAGRAGGVAAHWPAPAKGSA